MVKFAKLSQVDRINFAEELAKHIATINERVLSTSSVVTYKSGKSVVAKKGDMYALWTVCHPQYEALDSYVKTCVLWFKDFDLLWDYRNELKKLDLYIENDWIKVRHIGEFVMNRI